MSKPKPTPAEKASMDIIRSEIRSLDVQIRMAEKTVKVVFELHKQIYVQLQSLKDQKYDLRQKADKITP